MIVLTEEQSRELQKDFARAIDPKTKKVYVLVSEEKYEGIQVLLAPGRVPLAEQKAILQAAGFRAGWDDPEMDVYDCEDADQQNP